MPIDPQGNDVSGAPPQGPIREIRNDDGTTPRRSDTLILPSNLVASYDATEKAIRIAAGASIGGEVLIAETTLAALATSYTSPTWTAGTYDELRIEYFLDTCFDLTLTYPGLGGHYYGILAAQAGAPFDDNTAQYIISSAGGAQRQSWGEIRCAIKTTGFDRVLVSASGQRNLTTEANSAFYTRGGTTDTTTHITSVAMAFNALIVGGWVRLYGTRPV